MKKLRTVFSIVVLCVIQLSWSAVPNCSFEFALITDIHISNNETSIDDLKNTVSSINNTPAVQFVFVSGDLTEGGDPGSLMKAKNLLDQLQVPYFAVPGNHETKWSESGVLDFSKIFGSDRFRFDYGNFVFLGFNSGPIIRMMDGHVGMQDIHWLENELKSVELYKDIIIVTHYPLQSGDVDNWYEVTDLLRKYNVKAVLNGHYHTNKMTAYDGIPAFINRSNLRGKSDAGGYSVYVVTQDSILVREQIIGKPARPWGGYALRKRYYTEDNSAYPRPDFSVNQQYPQVKSLWIVKIQAAIYSSPVVSGDKVYVGDDLGVLSCLSLKDGQLLWQFESKSRILGTPAVGNNVVVFGSTDQYIYGVHAETGKLIWKLKTDAAVMGAVTIDKNRAYIGSSDQVFRCIDIRNGKLIWQYQGVTGYVETRPLLYNNKIIFGAWDSYLYALNKRNGKLAWKWNNGNNRMHFSPAAVWPVGAYGKVFFSAPDRVLTALNAKNGEVVWRTKESMVRETIGLSADKKRIFSKTMQDSVVCYDAKLKEPKKLWSVNVGYGYDHAPSMLMEKDNIVYGSTKNGLIFALDSFTGAVLWKHKVGNSLINTVLPLGDGKCLVTSAEGYVGVIMN
ncbi:MAG: PQQ-binding-like beta-propeller repeat protein [Paludibacter sp.]|nr:PQQ-binding-like beta-propeller repeat protein [Paludibacter sp.]